MKAITPGEMVRMKLSSQDSWSPGTCTRKVADRSYVVQVGDTEYRRNRRQIQRTNKPPIPKPEIPEADETVPAPLKDSQAKFLIQAARILPLMATMVSTGRIVPARHLPGTRTM